MPEEKSKVKYDVDGYEVVTSAIMDLLNSYPGLLPDEKIKFSTVEKDSGITCYPVSGAVIALEKKYVTGTVDQLCNYPFYILYRTAIDAGNVKADIKEFLDGLGKWLEKQPVTIYGKIYTLEEYPELTEGRKIEEITRLTPSYLDNVSENNVQDWVISLSLKYRNKFKRTN